LLSKYLKCSVWRLAVGYDLYIYIYVVRRQRVNRMYSRDLSFYCGTARRRADDIGAA
jgi:hypothetical protein